MHAVRVTMSKNVVRKGEILHNKDYLMSNNGEWKAVFQEDGNFVVYGWKPTWASDTYGLGGKKLVMQDDSNLVMYKDLANSSPKNAVWQTNTWMPNFRNCQLKLMENGDLVVERDGCEVWNSKNSKGLK
ncbi:hypothetical protein DPEC_G00188620 [Dallia pectoralis]|uniref:Uncharacterized protein n=1 Tax=Dallia pectoralis TaxID=75939 RepID=A0ACC2GCI4_DALPE|nr:hypothetical protein DPEC_G00188620 [Dallia pectoralis]